MARKVVKDYCWQVLCKSLKTVTKRDIREVQSIALVLVKLVTLEKKLKIECAVCALAKKNSGHFHEFADCSG